MKEDEIRWGGDFFRGKNYIMGLFRGIFCGPRLNCPERSEGQFWGEKGLGSLEKKSQINAPLFGLPKAKKIISHTSRIRGTRSVHCYFYVQRDIKPQ